MKKTSIAITVVVVLAAAFGAYFLFGNKPAPASMTGNSNPPATQTPGTLPSENPPSTTPPPTSPPPTTPPPTTPPPSTPPPTTPPPVTPPPTTPQTTPPPAPQPVSIGIQNFAFGPSSITIKTGTKVTWTNQDSAPHTIVSDSSSAVNFSSSSLSTGQSFSFTFTTPGTYTYHCSIHPFMTGIIIVTQ